MREILNKRILILDGAMGTLIQQYKLGEEDFRGARFSAHELPLKGNNDILNITRPDVIASIHLKYIEAGADIISTNTFSSQRISQKDYGLADLAREMAYKGALIARSVADAQRDRKIWVAGSMGPTNKTLSLASDIAKPESRSIDFDELSRAYYEQAEALVEGGVDVLLLETCFDALNVKAALCAIERINEKREQPIEVMVSATLNDRSGRTLTGQTLEAFYVAISHYPILSFGINCSFGIEALKPFVRHLADVVPAFISVHPNAGMPNEMGEYDESPDFTARHLKALAEEGCINIVGGCCGTTPRHIQSIAEAMRGVKPHVPKEKDSRLHLSGLEPIVVDRELNNFTNIGERTNVAGSRKFARLIAAHDFEAAADIARHQVENGASVIDINMDDAMLDSAEEMKNFVRFISNDPAIAEVPFMIDSSNWPTILQGLKNAQGKCIVNSISLKAGEEEFIEKARQIRQLGAAVVVMAFDEIGQATTYERKIEICRRAYSLLVDKVKFPPQDIIFDVNVLSVGTGIEEHANYGVDFIKAVAWIKSNLPEAKTSGGLSNLSFAFRGNNAVREAMHSVFLYHAIKAGLDMAIMNPSMIQVYDEIEPHLLKCCEDVILNKNAEATEKLIELASEIKAKADALKAGSSGGSPATKKAADWRKGNASERLAYALSKGVADYLEEDIREAYAEQGSAVGVIEGPLMQGMERVGKMFGEGKMFLPQVVKAAKVMKQAVAFLQPMMEAAENEGERNVEKPKIVMATAKGDVHDIGKNIVDIVLACNNFDVIDLGVMVDGEKILQTAEREKPVMVGISGLITPSLKEMENVCRLFEQNGMNMPIFVGGATTSAVHTAVKLAPLYSGGVFYGSDASMTSVLAKKLMAYPRKTMADNIESQQHVREIYENRKIEISSYEEANAHAPKLDMNSLHTMEEMKPAENLLPTLSDIEPLINWKMLLAFWGFRGKDLNAVNGKDPHAMPMGEDKWRFEPNEEAIKTLRDARELFRKVKEDGSLQLKSMLRFFPAHREGNDIVTADGVRLPMLRSQRGRFLSLADYLPADKDAPLGMLCVTVHDVLKDEVADQYQQLMRYALRARIAEAAAEWMQTHAAAGRNAIRPAFGYASCPDHSLKRVVIDKLDAEEKLGISLTYNYSITPSTTICGLLIVHPEAHYFSVGKIDDEQFFDYIKRNNMTEEEGHQFLGENL